jgi:hypothetical protein
MIGERAVFAFVGDHPSDDAVVRGALSSFLFALGARRHRK